MYVASNRWWMTLVWLAMGMGRFGTSASYICRYLCDSLCLLSYPGAKACGSDLRVHYKNTRETVAVIRGKKFKDAVKYLEDVIEHKEIVPFRRFRHTVGRKAQAAKHNWTQGRWPEKSCRFVLQLLKNAESNATQKNLNPEELVVSHIMVNMARKSRRRTYRAHGRINRMYNLWMWWWFCYYFVIICIWCLYHV